MCCPCAGVQGDNPCIKEHVCRGRDQNFLQGSVYSMYVVRHLLECGVLLQGTEPQ